MFKQRTLECSSVLKMKMRFRGSQQLIRALIVDHWAHRTGSELRGFSISFSFHPLVRPPISSLRAFLALQTICQCNTSVPLDTPRRFALRIGHLSFVEPGLQQAVSRPQLRRASHGSVTQTNGKFELPCDGNRLQFDEIAEPTSNEREHHCSLLFRRLAARLFSSYSRSHASFIYLATPACFSGGERSPRDRTIRRGLPRRLTVIIR